MLYDETNNKYDLDYNEIYDYEYDIDKVNKNSYNDVDINIDSINFNRDNSLYSPMEGFNKGNMFKNLYSKYKNHIYKLKLSIKKMSYYVYILQMYSFAMKDMNLYLDVYPDDKNILNSFHDYRKKYEALKKQYESEYGPLCMSNTLNTEKWTWVSNPWPWDKGGNN